MSRILLYHSSYHCNLFFITMQSFARISACILLVVGNNDSQKAVHLSKICQLPIIMRTKLLALLFMLTPVGLLAQGWPANYGGVMLQGFYWDSYSETKWVDLTNQADELSKYFSLIWVPNSGMTSSYYHHPSSVSMGYDPCFWLNHNSCWGTETELRTMINTFKSKGTGIIEDVVINHKNGLTDWCDFPEETWEGHGTMTWSLADICRGDDGGNTASNYNITGNDDTGDDFNGYRDLDHTSENVQKNVKLYLDFLLNDLGYAGFRYDMVKGYGAQYTKLYNEDAKPTFSVGEYWDSKDNIYRWVDATDKTSAAFDFGLKYTINSAFGSSNWSALSDKGMAADINGYSQYSVTFVDNHDTYRNHDKLGSNVLAANAFLLAMPGTPCIFWPHWTAYKNELKKMIKARQAAGITNTSRIVEQHEQGGGYVTKVEGSTGKYVLVISGYVTDYNTDGFVAVSTGTAANPNYAFYVSDNVDLGDLTAMPQVTMASGNYYPTVSTTLSASKDGATLVYTTDGSEPTATNGTQTTSSVDFTFDETTTLKAGILYEGEVINVEEFTYNISQSALRIYARSLSDAQMYFYTYDGAEVNGSWGEGNIINNTTVIDGKTWYYFDYDLKTYPNLRIIVRDGNGNRYPADGQPGVPIDDIKEKPYIILNGNSINTYNEEELDAFGTYYLVSNELTGGEKLESFKFQNVRRRDAGEALDANLFSLTVNDHDIPSGGITYYVAGIDENGTEVTYRPDSNYGLAMNANDNKYNDQDGNTRETPSYQSYDNCKQQNSNVFMLEKGKAASYSWTLNTGASGNVGVDAEWHYDEDKWYGYPYGKYSVALNLNQSISDDADGFYLFGNLQWDDSQGDWVWEAQKDEKFKFVRDEAQTDSIVYYVDVSNEGHPFKNLYLTIAPSTLLGTPISNWSNTQWSKAIRMMAPADRNAIALSGGLTVPDNYGIGNKNQAFNPEIDADVYDSYRLYINLTSATYGIIFKTHPYLVGTAVGKNFAAPDEAIALEWDNQEECYKYKGEFTNGGEMRFIINKSYKLNWCEDSEVAGSSTVDGDYYNHVAYDTKGKENEDQLSGNRISFNAPTGTYTLRFYMGENGAGSYYTLSRDIPLRNMTYISSSSTGEKYGEIVESTRTIDGTVYQSATSWADNVAYAKPENVDVYVVTGLDKSGEIYKVVLKKLDTDYIPANTGVLLFSQDAPENGTDRNLLVEATGYATANAGYNGNDNMLKAVITPLFIPGTVTGSDGNVVQRNFTFGYYRVKPYAEGTTTRGNYAYYLGFWRSSVSATDNPTEHLSSANMAYLSLTPDEYGTSELGLYDAPGNPAEAPYIHFTFDDSPVGITTIQETSTSDNGYYTLQGVKVNRPTSKGIYIHQGKKIIFK